MKATAGADPVRASPCSLRIRTTWWSVEDGGHRADDQMTNHKPPRRLFLQASTDANEASQGKDQRRPNTRLGIMVNSHPGSCTAAAQTIDSPARTSTTAAVIVPVVPHHARVPARTKQVTPMPARTARPTGERYQGRRSSPVTSSLIPDFLRRGSRAVKSARLDSLTVLAGSPSAR